MKYSFILIAYNEANTISACITSILQQKKIGTSYEILVIDDGSTDATASIVHNISSKNAKVKLLGDGRNHGRGYGRYTGVNAAKGDIIIMIDADIVLSPDWLSITLPYLQTHDVAGGIAVPDGDVAYIYRRFRLQPKTVMGSTTITGNNGAYQRQVFTDINFDPKLREGEDVDFSHRLQQAGYTSICIPGLTVEHQEHKSFARSMQWLYQSGIGATRQLIRFKEIRLPDLAFVATLVTAFAAIVATLLAGYYAALALPVLLIIAAATLHVRGKFYLSAAWPLRSLGAIATDSLLIVCYYVGRVVGCGVIISTVFPGKPDPDHAHSSL